MNTDQPTLAEDIKTVEKSIGATYPKNSAAEKELATALARVIEAARQTDPLVQNNLSLMEQDKRTRAELDHLRVELHKAEQEVARQRRQVEEQKNKHIVESLAIINSEAALRRALDEIEKYIRMNRDGERDGLLRAVHDDDLAIVVNERARVAPECPNALLPDGPVCPRCGGERAPSGVDGGSWVHVRVAPEQGVSRG